MRKNVVILFLFLIGLVATSTAEAQRRRTFRSRRVVTRRAPRPLFRSYGYRPSVSIGYRSGFYRSPFYYPRSSFYYPRYGGWGGWGPGGGVFIGGRRFSIGIGF